MTEQDIRARDKFYSEIQTSPNTNSQPVAWLLPYVKKVQLEEHIFGGQQLPRVRFFHNNGFVAKAEFLSQPAIIRLSSINIVPFGDKLIGLGIRYWQDGKPQDVIALGFAEPKVSQVGTSIFPDKSSQYVFYNFFATSLSRIGKVPNFTCVTLPHIGKTCEKVTFSLDTPMSYESAIKSKGMSWNVSLGDHELGKLTTGEFNQKPEFGYNIRFDHKGLIPYKLKLPEHLDQFYSVILAKIGIYRKFRGEQKSEK